MAWLPSLYWPISSKSMRYRCAGNRNLPVWPLVRVHIYGSWFIFVFGDLERCNYNVFDLWCWNIWKLIYFYWPTSSKSIELLIQVLQTRFKSYFPRNFVWKHTLILFTWASCKFYLSIRKCFVSPLTTIHQLRATYVDFHLIHCGLLHRPYKFSRYTEYVHLAISLISHLACNLQELWWHSIQNLCIWIERGQETPSTRMSNSMGNLLHVAMLHVLDPNLMHV